MSRTVQPRLHPHHLLVSHLNTEQFYLEGSPNVFTPAARSGRPSRFKSPRVTKGPTLERIPPNSQTTTKQTGDSIACSDSSMQPTHSVHLIPPHHPSSIIHLSFCLRHHSTRWPWQGILFHSLFFSLYQSFTSIFFTTDGFYLVSAAIAAYTTKDGCAIPAPGSFHCLDTTVTGH